MSNLYKYIPMKSKKINIESYKNEFDDIRVFSNIEKCKKLGRILLYLNILLILVDLIVYKPMRIENISYLYLFYSHIMAFILIIFWFILLNLNKNNSNVLSRKFLYHFLATIIMYWGVFLGLNDLYISGQISAYIICIFGISAFLYITPLEAFLTYFISVVVFIIGLIFIVGNTKILFSHIINTLIAGFISYIVSKLRFISFSKDFINTKDILISKMELEATNQKLKESNIMLKNEIKDRLLAEEKISYLIYYDTLTGIFNRKKMIEEIKALLDNKNEKFAVLFIDLDKFKSINDKYGHEAGDNILIAAAGRLKSIISSRDIVSRIGGDEFIILLRDLKVSTYAEEIATNIIETLSTAFTYNENQLFIGASIGISIFPKHGTDADTLINKADLAMYQVKNSGGCGYNIYNDITK